MEIFILFIELWFAVHMTPFSSIARLLLRARSSDSTHLYWSTLLVGCLYQYTTTVTLSLQTFLFFCNNVLGSSFCSLAAYSNGCVLLIIFPHLYSILSRYITILLSPSHWPLFFVWSVSAGAYILFWNPGCRVIYSFLKSELLKSVTQ
jgi:hypothetical protein